MNRSPIVDYVRHLLAIIVIVSHAWQQLGGSELWIVGVTPGALAVCVFFLISGYLISASWRRDPRTLPFVLRRTARIAPAWIAALTLGFILGRLCDQFAVNPWPVVNQSLWTLPWEVACYLLVILLRGRVWLIAPIAAVLFVLRIGEGAPFLMLLFCVGGLLPRPPRLPAFLPQLPCDWSYGLYVYAFPVAQLIIWLHGTSISPLLLSTLTLAALVPLCAVSWRYLEAPILRRVSSRNTQAELIPAHLPNHDLQR